MNSYAILLCHSFYTEQKALPVLIIIDNHILPLPTIENTAKHATCSHDHNLPPHLFRGREIALSVTEVKRFAAAPGLIKSVAK
jgi:hypothetical protein